jgi:hypothetical protein
VECPRVLEELFETLEAMQRTRRAIDAGGHVEEPTFCMVREPAELESADDPRLVLNRALILAASKRPGDDVFVAIDLSNPNPVRLFDWSQRPPRWVVVTTLESFVVQVRQAAG